MNEMSFLFFFNLSAILFVSHQAIGLMVMGNSPMNMAAEMLGVSRWQLYVVQLISLLGTAAIWYVLPVWVVIGQILVFELVAIRQLLKWRKILNERRS